MQNINLTVFLVELFEELSELFLHLLRLFLVADPFVGCFNQSSADAFHQFAIGCSAKKQGCRNKRRIASRFVFICRFFKLSDFGCQFRLPLSVWFVIADKREQFDVNDFINHCDLLIKSARLGCAKRASKTFVAFWSIDALQRIFTLIDLSADVFGEALVHIDAFVVFGEGVARWTVNASVILSRMEIPAFRWNSTADFWSSFSAPISVTGHDLVFLIEHFDKSVFASAFQPVNIIDAVVLLAATSVLGSVAAEISRASLFVVRQIVQNEAIFALAVESSWLVQAFVFSFAAGVLAFIGAFVIHVAVVSIVNIVDVAVGHSSSIPCGFDRRWLIFVASHVKIWLTVILLPDIVIHC